MASSKLGTLTLDLIAKTGGFEKGMDRAGRKAKQRTTAMQRRFKKTAAAAKRVFKVISVAAIAAFGAIAKGTNDAIKSMADMQDSADALGVTAKQYSSLAFAAKSVGVESKTLDNVLAKLNRRMANASTGSKQQQEMFKSLGVTIKGADGHMRASIDVLEDLAAAYKRTGASTDFIATANQLLGNKFRDIIPLISGGKDAMEAMRKEAEKTGNVFDNKAGRAAQNFAITMTKLQSLLRGIFVQFASRILPALNTFAQNMFESNTQTGKLSSAVDGLMKAFKGLIVIGQVVASVFDGIVLALKALVGVVGGLMGTIRQDLKGALALKRGDWQGVLDAAKGIKDVWGTSLGFIDESIDKTNKKLKDHWSLIQKVMSGKAFSSSSSGNPTAPDLSKINPGNVLGAAAGGGSSSAGAKAGKNYVDSVFEGAKTELDKLAQNNADMAESLTRALLPKEAMKADFKKQIADIYSTFADPSTRAKYLQAAAQQYADHWRNMTDSVQTANDQMSQFAKQAANNMQDAFAQFLFDPFRDGLKGLLGNFIDTLRQMATQALAARVFDSLGAGGNSGGSSGILGSLLGSVFGGGKAVGGSVAAGRFYEVNENRPELLSVGGRDFLMMGNRAGRVDPNPQSVTRGSSTTINVAVQPTSTRRTASQVATEIARKQRLASSRNS